MSVNSGSWATSGFVDNDDIIQLKLTTSANPNTSITPTLYIGSSNATWSVTTGAFYSSCKNIIDTGNSNGDGLYTIYISGTSVQVYCDMTTDGGGYTLVKSGIGGTTSIGNWNNASGYSTTKSATLNSNDYALTDAQTNHLKTVAYRVEGTCNSWSSQNTAYAKPACVYSSVAGVDNSADCRTWYTSSALTTVLGYTENYGNHIAYYGIRDVHSGFSGSYITTQAGGIWYVGYGGLGAICDGTNASSRLRIWVK